MTPPTAREALAELARRLEHQDDATWLPPVAVARLVREFADTIPDEAERPETTPDDGPGPDNDQLVGVQGMQWVCVLLPKTRMTAAEARAHAAWLIAMADCAGQDYAVDCLTPGQVLRAVGRA